VAPDAHGTELKDLVGIARRPREDLRRRPVRLRREHGRHQGFSLQAGQGAPLGGKLLDLGARNHDRDVVEARLRHVDGGEGRRLGLLGRLELRAHGDDDAGDGRRECRADDQRTSGRRRKAFAGGGPARAHS
jgi:hypothetical protein